MIRFIIFTRVLAAIAAFTNLVFLVLALIRGDTFTGFLSAILVILMVWLFWEQGDRLREERYAAAARARVKAKLDRILDERGIR